MNDIGSRMVSVQWNGQYIWLFLFVRAGIHPDSTLLIVLAHLAGCSDCHLRQNYFVLDKYLVINHDFRFLAPICICTLGISKYLLIFGFVTFHILDIWKNLYLQIEKTHFQKPTLFVWWCFTEKCHALGWWLVSCKCSYKSVCRRKREAEWQNAFS